MKHKIRSIKNFRDLGGIPTSDGRHIRPGLLYRSGHLAALVPGDAAHLHDRLGLRRVIDLRSPSERSERPDVYISGIDYCPLPPLNDSQNPSINRHNRRNELNRLMAVQGGTRRHLTDIYRLMVREELPLDVFARIIHMLICSPEGTLWHCTQGKDRTGVASAAVLLALGVSREEIMKDYMSTNRTCRWKNLLIYLGVSIAALSLHTASSLNNLLTSRREYLQAMFDELDARFGGTAGFLHDGLGLSDSDISRLRAIYLE